MSFPIQLQHNFSEKNMLDKYVIDVINVVGELKEDTSIVDPIITFNGDMARYKDVNYMSIGAFGRSYFVTDIRSLRNGLIQLSAHVDVLSTYKEQIRKLYAIVSKQEQSYNLYLNDGTIKIYQDRRISTKKFSGQFSVITTILTLLGGE